MTVKKLSPKEAAEWRAIQSLSKKHGIPASRVGPANVSFGGGVYAQLGTGVGKGIMKAKVDVTKKRKSRKKGR